MSSSPEAALKPPGPRAPTVFLSYASEDRPAAQALRDALPAYGVEVWYDETELAGGDAWDQKIRRQIRDCDFFMPVISAQTEARHEGYFRREWRLAAERSLDMSDDHLFLLPVVIDGTSQAGARVPEKFLSVQWTRVPGGQPNAAFESLCRRLLMGDVRPVIPTRPAPRAYTPIEAAPAGAPDPGTGPGPALPPPHPAALARPLPPLPLEEPGQKARFVLEVIVWLMESAWTLFNRLPGLWRGLAYLWMTFWLVSNVLGHHARPEALPSRAQASQLNELAAKYEGQRPEDIAHLGKQVKHALGDAVTDEDAGSTETPLLAIPFSAPADDPDARKLADAAFAQVYGRLALSHHGHMNLLEEPLPSVDNATALARARQHHADYVLFGALAGEGSGARLSVTMLEVDDGTEAWSKSYPAQGIDTAALATEVDERVHQHE